MSIKYLDYFKFGVIQSLIEVLIIVLFIGSLADTGAKLGLFAGFLGTAFVMLLVIMAIGGGLLAMAGKWLYKILKLKLSKFWMLWFVTTIPGLIMSVLQSGLLITNLIMIAAAGTGFTWLTIKAYELIKWRLPA